MQESSFTCHQSILHFHKSAGSSSFIIDRLILTGDWVLPISTQAVSSDGELCAAGEGVPEERSSRRCHWDLPQSRQVSPTTTISIALIGPWVTWLCVPPPPDCADTVLRTLTFSQRWASSTCNQGPLKKLLIVSAAHSPLTLPTLRLY